MVAIDGSRLRAVNTHEKNYTKGKLARRKAHVEESIARYLAELEEADSAETGPATPRIEHLTERLASLRGRLRELEEIGQQLQAAPDEQVSLTDPDARAMATGSDHRGVVGYNVQAAVDTEHHLLAACGGVEQRFSCTITGIRETRDAVDLTLSDGTEERFDLLIGADGLHSNVRHRVFGPHETFERPTGLNVAACTLSGYRPREDDAYVMYTRPHRQVSRAAFRDDRTLFLLVFNEKLVAPGHGAPREMLRAAFADMGWETGAILDQIDEADDLYLDTISQVVMPTWSKGRVALLGDAAACISLLGGEGTGLAMTAAYVLAGEFARAPDDHQRAFSRYEDIMRPLLDRKQENARKFTAFFAPPSWPILLLRDALNLLVSVPVIGRWMIARSFQSDFQLPDYSPMLTKKT